jgi:hypothetical protein
MTLGGESGFLLLEEGGGLSFLRKIISGVGSFSGPVEWPGLLQDIRGQCILKANSPHFSEIPWLIRERVYR